MQVGIIGAGKIGQAVATRLVTADHEVMLANSRGPDTLAALEQSLGENAHAGTLPEAASYGDVVVLATPLSALDALPVQLLDGRILVDANNYYPDRDGAIPELQDGSLGSSELLAGRVPGARIVKAFNTMLYSRIEHEARPAGARERLGMPLAGDDDGAKAVVAGLIDDMGFDPVDAGSLRDGRNQQPGTPVYNQPVDAAGVRAALGL